MFQSDQNRQYFEQTGHWVEGEFLDFYNSTPNAVRLFGYPITEAGKHPNFPNLTIQHFQRARFQLDPKGEPGQRVTLAPLGEYLYSDQDVQHGEKAGFAVTSGACRLFPANNISVCYAFLQFYDANQGATYFGQPISEVEIVDNRLVQYFEYARMEWRPEMPVGQRVVLTDIGRLDFDTVIGDDGLLHENNSFEIPLSSPLSIKVFAFPSRPLLALDQKQTIFVIVQDQVAEPVENATVTISLLLPDGSRQNLATQAPTNKDGFTQIEFSLENIKPNQVVEVQVQATLTSGLQSATATRFRAWW